MPRKCCIPGCNSNYGNSLKRGGSAVSTFQFPRNEELHKKWLDSIPREDWKPTKTSAVCIKHFQEDDVIRHQALKLMNGDLQNFISQSHPKLKAGAIPRIFSGLPSKETNGGQRTDPECQRQAANEANNSKKMQQIKEEVEEYINNEYGLMNDRHLMEHEEKSESISQFEPLAKSESQEFDECGEDRVSIKDEGVLLKDEKIFPDSCLDEEKKFHTICNISQSDSCESHLINNYPVTIDNTAMPMNEKRQNQEYKDDFLLASGIYKKLSSKKTEFKETYSRNCQFNCSFCNKLFFQKNDLLSHEYMHKGDYPYSCDICGKSFTRRSTPVGHNRTHTGVGPFLCNVCKQSISRKLTLKAQKHTHTVERQFSCNICNVLFTKNPHLITHMLNHSGDRLFFCDLCCKTFSRKYNLTLHMRHHTGERPYSCDSCGGSFSRKDNLKLHVQRCHKGPAT